MDTKVRTALTKLNNNSTDTIDLSSCSLSGEPLVALTSALASNTSLRSLNLEDTALNSQDAAVLAKVLVQHSGIQRLVVDENPLGQPGMEAILNLFANHSTLYKVSAISTGATKDQRLRLKQLSKAAKHRKPTEKPSARSLNELDSRLLETVFDTFYDRAWGGTQIMAEPVFHPVDGKVYERERLLAHEPKLKKGCPFTVAVGLQQQIHQYLAQRPQLWHQGRTGVYIPYAWRKAVLRAIKSGDRKTLQQYWQRHPGLVTCTYPLNNRNVGLLEIFIAKGHYQDFEDWLEQYGEQADKAQLPSFELMFADIVQGKHALHHIIGHKRPFSWSRTILCDLAVSGDNYHGLVHLHQAETATADAQAIRLLVEQNQLPCGRNKKGLTPLMLAIQQEKYDIAAQLLLHSEPNSLDLKGDSALHYAVRCSRSQARDSMILELLSSGIDDTLLNDLKQTAEAVLEEREAGYYPLLLRKSNQQLWAKVQRLQQTQEHTIIDFAARQAQFEDTITSLVEQLRALSLSHTQLTDKVQRLTEENAQLTAFNEKRRTALQRALPMRQPRNNWYYLQKPENKWLLELFLVAIPELDGVLEEQKQLDLQKLLVNSVQDINANIWKMKDLLKQGADLSASDDSGRYPLITAVLSQTFGIAVYIIKHIGAQQLALPIHEGYHYKDRYPILSAIDSLKPKAVSFIISHVGTKHLALPEVRAYATLVRLAANFTKEWPLSKLAAMRYGMKAENLIKLIIDKLQPFEGTTFDGFCPLRKWCKSTLLRGKSFWDEPKNMDYINRELCRKAEACLFYKENFNLICIHEFLTKPQLAQRDWKEFELWDSEKSKLLEEL